MKSIFLTLFASMFAGSAMAGPAVLVPPISKEPINQSQLFTNDAKTTKLDGVGEGESRAVRSGDKLFSGNVVTYTTETTIEVTSPLTIVGDGTELTITPSERIKPAARFLDGQRSTFYLVPTDASKSTFMRKSRFVAISADGNVIDHTFSPNSTERERWNLFSVREPLTSISNGMIVVSNKERAGAAACTITAVYQGSGDGVINMKLLRVAPSGDVIAQRDRVLSADIKDVNLAGVNVHIDAVSKEAIQVKIGRGSRPTCSGQL